MIYAPIIIPTLNRVEHLERCLNSLKNNSWASKTPVYISVDFPPAEKYVAGHEKVCEFLKEKENEYSTAFKEFNVFFQSKNLGAMENHYFLRDQLMKEYDRYISTEDDNEFAPNFLEYIDKCLDYFENDQRIIAVCGYRDVKWETDDDNIALVKLFPAYGYGTWVDRIDSYNKKIRDLLTDWEKIGNRYRKILKKNNRCLYDIYLNRVVFSQDSPFWYGDRLREIDTNISTYMTMTDSFVIVPSVSKSRTWGNDGSGVNMPKISGENPLDFELDENDSFDLVIAGKERQKHEGEDELKMKDANIVLSREFMKRENWKSLRIKSIIEEIIFVLCKYNRDKAKKIKERL